MVPVELTRRQRIYLLWTFRHFRQLSLPLLNRRQLELIHTLARNSAGAELQSLRSGVGGRRCREFCAGKEG